MNLSEVISEKLAQDEQPVLDNDSEYYFVYGHIVRYFLARLSPQGERTLEVQSWEQKFDNARVPANQKQIVESFMRHNERLINYKNVKLKRALAMFFGYKPDMLKHHGDASQFYSLGLTVQGLFK
ncbi:hypothetical protein V3851_09590 [Paenibacillus sp. M1]|uniref:Uncharacterized protein n=1 Tax=Paenibacillus haidiansis TaxID=1574488 RepID=A0ABU7VQM7_9BACL